jgi:hypothetical protein
MLTTWRTLSSFRTTTSSSFFSGKPQSAAYVGLIYYVSYFRTLMILMTMLCNRPCVCLGHLVVIKVPFRYLFWATCDDVQLCNRCVREFLILSRIWFAFGLSSKTGCDTYRQPTRLGLGLIGYEWPASLGVYRLRAVSGPTRPLWLGVGVVNVTQWASPGQARNPLEWLPSIHPTLLSAPPRLTLGSVPRVYPERFIQGGPFPRLSTD